MKKIMMLGCVAGLTLTLLACGESRQNADAGGAATTATIAPQDSGVLGIPVPGSATTRSDGTPSLSASFDASGMTFEQTAQWMGDHLPVDDAVEGMQPCDAERLSTMHAWYWAGATNTDGTTPMLSVTVSDRTPPQIVVLHAPDDAAGC